MAFQDSDPERRNLMVTSLAFIAYFLGGGHLKEDAIALEVVNISFSRGWVLATMAWLGLLWFAYRYWVTHKEAFRKEFEEEIPLLSNSKIIQKEIEKIYEKPIAMDSEDGLHVDSVVLAHWKITVNVCFAKSVGRDANRGVVNSWSGPINTDTTKISRLATLRIFATCAIANKSFSSYIIPHIAFFLALTTGIIGMAIRVI